MSTGLGFDTSDVVRNVDKAVGSIDGLITSLGKLESATRNLRLDPVEVKTKLEGDLMLRDALIKTIKQAEAGLPPLDLKGVVNPQKIVIKKSDDPSTYEQRIANTPRAKKVNQHLAVAFQDAGKGLHAFVSEVLQVNKATTELFKTAATLPSTTQQFMQGQAKHFGDAKNALFGYGDALKILSGEAKTTYAQLTAVQNAFDNARQLKPLSLSEVEVFQTSGAKLGPAERIALKEAKDNLAQQTADLAQKERLFKANEALDNKKVAAAEAAYRKLLGLRKQIDAAAPEDRQWLVDGLSRRHGADTIKNLDSDIADLESLIDTRKKVIASDIAKAAADKKANDDLNKTLANRANLNKFEASLEDARLAAKEGNLNKYSKLLRDLQNIQRQYEEGGFSDAARAKLSDRYGTDIVNNLDSTIRQVETRLQRLQAVQSGRQAQVAAQASSVAQSRNLNAVQQVQGDLVSARSIESLDRLGQTLGNLRRDFAAGIDTSRVYSGRWAQLASADVDRLHREYTNLRQAMEQGIPVGRSSGAPELVTQANHMRGAFDHLGHSTHSLHSAFRGLASGFNMMWLTWGEIIPLLAGAAVSMGVTETVKQGMEFETTLYRIENLAGITGKSLQELKQTFYEMGDSTIYSAQKAAEAAAILGLAGLKGAEVAKALRPTLAFAAAGEVTTEKAAEVLTAVGTAYAYAANSYSVVSDVIMKAAADSITSVDAMAESFKTASVLAQTYGVSLQDTAYALRGLAQIGITGSAAGTSLRNMYQELTKEPGAVGAAMKSLGVKAVAATGEMRPLLDIVTDLQLGLVNLTGSEQNRYKAIISNERGNKALSASLADFNKEYKAYIATLSAADQKLLEHGKTQQADVARKEAVMAASSRLRERLKQEFDSSQGMTFFANLEKSLTTAGNFEGVGASFKNSLLKAFDAAQPALNTFAISLRQVFSSQEVRDGMATFVTQVVRTGSAILEYGKTLGPVIEIGQNFAISLYEMGKALAVATESFLSLPSKIIELLTPLDNLSQQLAFVGVAYLTLRTGVLQFIAALAVKSTMMAASTAATLLNGQALSSTAAATAMAHRMTGAYVSTLATLTGQTTAATLSAMRHSGALATVGAVARVASGAVVAFNAVLSVATVVGMVLALGSLAAAYLSSGNAAEEAAKKQEQASADKLKELESQMTLSSTMLTDEINATDIKIKEIRKGSSAEEAATRVLGAQVLARVNAYYDQIEAIRKVRKELELNKVAEALPVGTVEEVNNYRAAIKGVNDSYSKLTADNEKDRQQAINKTRAQVDAQVSLQKKLSTLSEAASAKTRLKPQGAGLGDVQAGRPNTGRPNTGRTEFQRDFDLQFEKDRIAAIKSSGDKQLAIAKSNYDLQLDVAQASYDAGLSSFGQYQVALSALTQDSEAARLKIIADSVSKAEKEAERAHSRNLEIFTKELSEFKGTAEERESYRQKLAQKYVTNYEQVEQNLTSATESGEQQRVEITNDALKRRTLAYYKFMADVGKVIKSNQEFWDKEKVDEAKANELKSIGDQYRYISDQSTYSAQAEKAAAMARSEAYYKYQSEAVALTAELQKLQEQEEKLFNKQGDMSLEDQENLANVTIGKARLTSQLTAHSAQAGKSIADAAEKAYQQVQEGAVLQLQEATTDAIMTGLINGGEAGKRALRDIIMKELMKPVRMVIQAVVNPIVGAVAGAFGIGSSPATAMAGQAGSSMLGSAASSFASSTVLGGSSLAAIGESIGTGFMATLQGSSVSAAAGAYAAAGQTGVSAGLSIGAAAPWVLGALALLNGLGAFRKTKKVGGGLTGTLGEGGKVTDYDLMRKSGTLLSGPDYSTRVKDTASPLNNQIQNDWKLVTRSTLDLAASLGLSTEAAKNFSTTLGTDSVHPDLGMKGIKLDDLMNKGLSDEQYAQEVNKRINEALLQGSNELAQKILGSWQTTTRNVVEVIREGDTETEITRIVTDTKYVQSEFAKTGETAIETLTRLAGSLTTANTFFALLGTTLYESSLVGGDKASQWADSFGGADKFKEKIDAFINVAFSPVEQAGGKVAAFDKQVRSLGLSGTMSARSVRELVKGMDLSTEAGRDLSAKLIEIAPAMDATMDAFLQSVGVNATDLSATFSDGILKGYNPAALGDLVAGQLVANIEKSIIEQASKQIFDIITKDIVYPMIQAYLVGDALTAGVTEAAIQRAIDIANAYATLLKSETFKKLLGDISANLAPLLTQIGTTFQGTASHSAYLTRTLDGTGTAADSTADDLKDLTDEFNKLRNSLNNDYLELLKTSLTDAGKLSEAHAISLQQSALAEADFIAQNSKYSKDQQDELLILYRRNEATKLSNQLQRAKLDLETEYTQTQHDWLVETGDLAGAATLATQLQANAEREFLAQHVNLTDSQRDELLLLYRRNRAYEDSVDAIRKQREALATFWQAVDASIDRFLSGEVLKGFRYDRLAQQFNELFPHLDVTGAKLAALSVDDISKAVLDFTSSGASTEMKTQVIELAATLLDVSSDIRQERQSLLTRLYAATDTSSESLERQRSAIHASNRELFDQVIAAEAAKAAAAEKLGIEKQLLELLGNTAELRRRELEALHPTNRALQQRVWLLQDSVSATDKAFTALESAIAAQKKASDAAVETANTTVTNIRTIFDLLSDSVRQLYSEVFQTREHLSQLGMEFIDRALLTIRANGTLPDEKLLSNAISDVRASFDKPYTSVSAKNFDKLVLAGKLKGIQDVAGVQLTTAELQLKSAQEANKQLDDLLENYRKQIDIMRGTYAAVQSVELAITNLAEAIRQEAAARLAGVGGSGGVVSGGSGSGGSGSGGSGSGGSGSGGSGSGNTGRPYTGETYTDYMGNTVPLQDGNSRQFMEARELLRAQGLDAYNMHDLSLGLQQIGRGDVWSSIQSGLTMGMKDFSSNGVNQPVVYDSSGRVIDSYGGRPWYMTDTEYQHSLANWYANDQLVNGVYSYNAGGTQWSALDTGQVLIGNQLTDRETLFSALQDYAGAHGEQGAYDYLKGTGLSLSQIDNLLGTDLTKYVEDAGLPQFAVGTNYVPQDMVALLHKGEAVVPARYNDAKAYKSSDEDTDRVAALLAVLIERVDRLTAQSTRTANAVNGRGEMPQLVKTT